MKKKINILSHQGNANQNDIEIPSHPSQNGYQQENEQQQMLVGCWERKDSKYIVGKKVN
jgi:hypothetical protein